MADVEIKRRHTGDVLYVHEATDERVALGLEMRDALEAACKARAGLRDADLRGAYLGGAYLRGADLRDAYLRGAYLRGADLRDADLRGAYLRGAYLGDAYLGGAYLGGAYLDGAYLGGAYLDGANLGGAKLIGGRPVLFIGPIGSRSDYMQASITDAGVMIRAGCFSGTRNEFAARVRSEHGDTAHGREYAAALAVIDAHASLWTPPAEPVEVPA